MNTKRNIIHKTISMMYPLIPFYRVVTLNYIKKCSKRLANKVLLEYQPDIAIGIANGGLYPTFEVSRHLGCEIDTIQIMHYKNRIPVLHDVPGSAKVIRDFMLINLKPVLIENTKSKSLEGKKILLVDDETGSGITLEFAKKILERKNPQTLKTATIFRQDEYKPDFYAVKISNRCIINPWRKSSPYYENYLKELSKLGFM